jgi:hypothetical protein
MSLSIDCCLCELSFIDCNTLKMHIATDHIHYYAFECEYESCQMAKFPTSQSIRLHYLNIHKSTGIINKVGDKYNLMLLFGIE